MTSVVERGEHSIVFEDANGARRICLVSCPACGQPLSPHQSPAGLGYTPQVSEHLRMHSPEDFGLSPMVSNDGGIRSTGRQ